MTVRDACEQAGGMCATVAFPRIGCPGDIVDTEITRIVDLGVTLELGREVRDVVLLATVPAARTLNPNPWDGAGR